MFCRSQRRQQRFHGSLEFDPIQLHEIDQEVCLNMVKKDQLCAIVLMTKK